MGDQWLTSDGRSQVRSGLFQQRLPFGLEGEPSAHGFPPPPGTVARLATQVLGSRQPPARPDPEAPQTAPSPSVAPRPMLGRRERWERLCPEASGVTIPSARNHPRCPSLHWVALGHRTCAGATLHTRARPRRGLSSENTQGVCLYCMSLCFY